MAIPTPQTTENVIEIDSRGVARLYVAGVAVPGVISIESKHDRTGGHVSVLITSRAIRYRHVEKLGRIEPADDPV